MLFRLLPCLVLASTILAKLSTIQYSGLPNSDKCLSYDYALRTIVINDCNPTCLSSLQQNWVIYEALDPEYNTPIGSIIQLYNFNGVADAPEPDKDKSCLDVSELDNGPPSYGTLFVQETCNKDAALWDFNKETIFTSSKDAKKNLCLDLAGGLTTNNNSVLAWECTSTELKDNQKWKIVDSKSCTAP